MSGTTTNRPSGPSPLLYLLEQYPIFHSVCSCLDIGSLLAVQRLSKSEDFCKNHASHTRTRWDINRRLKRFVHNPSGLRSLMARHNALIAGSFAVQFFDDDIWEDSGLDVFVLEDRSGPCTEYMCKTEGYTTVSEVDNGGNRYPDEKGLPRMVKASTAPQTSTSQFRLPQQSHLHCKIILSKKIEARLYADTVL